VQIHTTNTYLHAASTQVQILRICWLVSTIIQHTTKDDNKLQHLHDCALLTMFVRHYVLLSWHSSVLLCNLSQEETSDAPKNTAEKQITVHSINNAQE